MRKQGRHETGERGEPSICKWGSDETIIRASPMTQRFYFGCDATYSYPMPSFVIAHF